MSLKGYKYVSAPSGYPGRIYSWGNRILEHHRTWWEHTGSIVPSGYVLHHINGKKDDNIFTNLELKKIEDHTRDHHLLAPPIILKCSFCGVEITRLARDVRSKSKAGQQNFFCSSSHAAKFGNRPREIRHGSPSAYSYRKCRCQLCKNAHAEKQRRYRSKKG